MMRSTDRAAQPARSLYANHLQAIGRPYPTGHYLILIGSAIHAAASDHVA